MSLDEVILIGAEQEAAKPVFTVGAANHDHSSHARSSPPDPTRPADMIDVAFVMEQHIGHRSYYQNLRRFIEREPRIRPTWVEVTYEPENQVWNRWPILPAHLRATLNGRTQVRQGLRNRSHDVVLFNTQVPAVLAGELARRRPHVVCTDITPIQFDKMGSQYGHKPDRDGLIGRLKHRANRRLFESADRILPWSNWTSCSLIEDYQVDPKRIEVLPPGVDLDLWKPIARTSQGPTRVLFVGGDLDRKGGFDLIRAFRKLPVGLAELVLVTRSPVPPEKGITTYNHIHPNSPELVRLYQSCDVFALPTKAEAFGIAAVEASSMGLPIVATPVGGLTDIVAEGVNGFLVPPGDILALSSSLLLLVENAALRRQLGLAGRKLAEKRFDARKNARRLTEILLEIAHMQVGHT